MHPEVQSLKAKVDSRISQSRRKSWITKKFDKEDISTELEHIAREHPETHTDLASMAATLFFAGRIGMLGSASVDKLERMLESLRSEYVNDRRQEKTETQLSNIEEKLQQGLTNTFSKMLKDMQQKKGQPDTHGLMRSHIYVIVGNMVISAAHRNFDLSKAAIPLLQKAIKKETKHREIKNALHALVNTAIVSSDMQVKKEALGMFESLEPLISWKRPANIKWNSLAPTRRKFIYPLQVLRDQIESAEA